MSDNARRWPVPFLLLLLVAALFFYQRGRMAMDLVAASDAREAPDLVVRDAQGGVRTLADLRGEVVVINLWADWCGPCRREVPRMERLHETFESAGLRLWAVNADGLAGARLQEAAAGLGIDYAVFEPVSGLERFPGGAVLPYTWLVDREGRLRAAHGGLPSEGSLRRAARRLLGEPSSR